MKLLVSAVSKFIIGAAIVAYPVVIAVRLLHEEKVLTEGLEGYTEYKQKVRYRLIPFIW